MTGYSPSVRRNSGFPVDERLIHQAEQRRRSAKNLLKEAA
jgi:hypothetical protein